MRVALLCLGLSLAACTDREEPVTPGPARDEQAWPPATAPAAPLDEAPSFVGAWAARADLCGAGAWMFTPQGVRTAGEVNCSWSKVEKTDRGYTLAGTCTGGEAAEPATVVLTFDPARAGVMTVSGGPWAGPVTLTRCAPTAASG